MNHINFKCNSSTFYNFFSFLNLTKEFKKSPELISANLQIPKERLLLFNSKLVF